jgi:hypothetical protein
MISGFCCEIGENSALLVYYTASSGNYAVTLNTVDCSRKIGALLEDPAYRRWSKDPTELVEYKMSLLLKKSTFAEEVCK